MKWWIKIFLLSLLGFSYAQISYAALINQPLHNASHSIGSSYEQFVQQIGNGYNDTISSISVYVDNQSTLYPSANYLLYECNTLTSLASIGSALTGCSSVGGSNSATTTGAMWFDAQLSYTLNPAKYYELFYQGITAFGTPPITKVYGSSATTTYSDTACFGGGGSPISCGFQAMAVKINTPTGNSVYIAYPMNDPTIISSAFPSFQLFGTFGSTDSSRTFVVNYGRSTTTLEFGPEFDDEVSVSGGSGSLSGDWIQYVSRTHTLLYPPLVAPQTYYAQAFVYNSTGQELASSSITTFLVSNLISQIQPDASSSAISFSLSTISLENVFPFCYLYQVNDALGAMNYATTTQSPSFTVNIYGSSTKIDVYALSKQYAGLGNMDFMYKILKYGMWILFLLYIILRFDTIWH